MQAIVPPLKWAGGKRWFVSEHYHLLPSKFNRYVEPFVGSGAVFFGMLPEKALLSDVNEELINLYAVIKNDPVRLAEKMHEHQKKHSFDYYYAMRDYRPRTDLNRSAKFLYLNRTCWNGLYRVNLKGEFNVPKGTKDKVVLATDDFVALSAILTNAEVFCQDFEVTLDSAESGDFAFVDPPYTVAHNTNGFIKYNQKLFRWEDQVRLRDAVVRAARRGVKVVVTNAAHGSVLALYKDFECVLVNRAGVISGSSHGRGQFQEVVARWI